MLRLSEEQRAILSCYSGTREEMLVELRRAISFIEDAELKEMSEELLIKIKRSEVDGFVEGTEESLYYD